MVISAVGANGIADRTRNGLVNQTNLWNVAITRAKAHLVIVGDRSWWTAQHGMLARIAAGSDALGQVDGRPARAADALHAAARVDRCRAQGCMPLPARGGRRVLRARRRRRPRLAGPGRRAKR